LTCKIYKTYIIHCVGTIPIQSATYTLYIGTAQNIYSIAFSYGDFLTAIPVHDLNTLVEISDIANVTFTTSGGTKAIASTTGDSSCSAVGDDTLFYTQMNVKNSTGTDLDLSEAFHGYFSFEDSAPISGSYIVESADGTALSNRDTTIPAGESRLVYL
jgi:hypothetical protein